MLPCRVCAGDEGSIAWSRGLDPGFLDTWGIDLAACDLQGDLTLVASMVEWVN